MHRPRHARGWLAALLVLSIGPGPVLAQMAPYCSLTTAGTRVEIVRPSPGAADVIDDVNWFARPVPNPANHRIIAYASHDLNYLYNLTTGARIRIPDKSDAVATPDGRFMTVPSIYTATATVNFYDTATLLERLQQGRDAADVPPLFAHKDPQVTAVYYQSIGVLPRAPGQPPETTIYRMMFSGSRVEPKPGFRIVDYTVTTRAGAPSQFAATPAMKLCPQITDDLATPFISKDGRYVVAHDRPAGQPGTLKIFEILATDPAAQTTTCAMRVDFGFAAGKADFSWDNSAVTFHISKHDYLTPFVSGGLVAPAITDVAVAQLRTEQGRIVGAGGVARVTTSQQEGVGSYFPAFFPDGRVFYIANATPKKSSEPKRFTFAVVDPAAELHVAGLFGDATRRAHAEAIGRLWRSACSPTMQDYKTGEEAMWYFLSLSSAQCRALVDERAPADMKSMLLSACATASRATTSQ